MSSIVWAAHVIALSLVFACSKAETEKKTPAKEGGREGGRIGDDLASPDGPGPSDGSSDGQQDDLQGGTGGGDGNQNGKDSGGTAGDDDDGGGGGDGDGDGDEGGDGGGDESSGADAPCKGFEAALAGPLDVKGKAKVLITSVDFHLLGKAAAAFTRKGTSGSLKIDVDLEKVTPALAKATAEKTVGAYADPLKLTLADAKEGAAWYAKHDGWRGLNCVVLPVKRLENANMIFEYEPALPMVVAPNASAASYAAIKSLTIKGISAKIVKSPNPSLVAAGASFTGKATLSGSGGSYRVKFDFGGLANTSKATPFSELVYGVSGGTYSEIVVHVPLDAESSVPIKLKK